MTVLKKEYMETLLGQIREKRARQLVLREVEGHIEDQKETYMSEGMPEDMAEEKAVADMGDPVETGMALDRIHRPKPAWGMLALIAVLCTAGVILQYTVRQLYEPPGQAGNDFFQHQCVYAAVGFLVLCGVYLADYTEIARYSRWMCAGILLFFIAAVKSGYLHSYHGSLRTLYVFGADISLDILLYLYVPLYGAVLYSYRNCKKRELWKVLLYTIVPVLLAARYTHLSQFLNLTVIFSVMFCVAAVKRRYDKVPDAVSDHTESRLCSPAKILCGIAAGLAAAGVILFIWAGSFADIYQIVRIQAWLHPQERYGRSYTACIIQDVLHGSRLTGGNMPESMKGRTLDFSTDFILTYLIGEFGVLAAAALILLVGMLGIKLLHISIHQKNQLGMMMGLGCGLVFAIQSAEYILVNLGLLPASELYFPLISYGGSGMMQTSILLGILLSTYRYQDVVSEPEMEHIDSAVRE